MAHPGAYRGTKRQKELKRLQKQQEKREKRLQKKAGDGEAEPELTEQPPLGAPPEAPAEPSAGEPPSEEGGERPADEP